MTFLVAWHTPTLALLACDTRLTNAEFNSPDGEPELGGFGDHGFRKLLWYHDGWVASASSLSWMGQAARYVRDLSAASPEAFPRALQTCAAETMPRIAVEAPGLATFIRKWFTLLLIGPTPDGFYVKGFTWDGADAYGTVAPGEVIACGPRNLKREAQDPRLEAYRQAVFEHDSPTLPRVIRETAHLIQGIHDLGGPAGMVSSLLEIGLLSRSGDAVRQQYLSPMECMAVMGASDGQLETMLEELR